MENEGVKSQVKVCETAPRFKPDWQLQVKAWFTLKLDFNAGKLQGSSHPVKCMLKPGYQRSNETSKRCMTSQIPVN